MNCWSSHIYAIYQDLISLISHLSERHLLSYCIVLELQESEIRPESLPSTLSELKSWKSKGHGFAVTFGRLHKASPVSREPKVTWRNGAMGLTVHGVLGFQICIMSDGS